MKYIFVSLLFVVKIACAQTTLTAFQQAFAKLEQDTCYQNAQISFTLLDVKSGEILFEKNKDLPLASASILKTFTTASAFHYLGESFRYQTRVCFKGQIKNKIANGHLIIYGCGDPSLGSDRFAETDASHIKNQISEGLKKLGIKTLKGRIDIVSDLFVDAGINSHWLEEDIANYYGAGIYSFNWKENKFNLNLSPKDTVFEVSSNDGGYNKQHDFCVELIPKETASTEDAFAFFENGKSCQYSIRGFLSPKVPNQSIQVARRHPDLDFKKELSAYLKQTLHFEEIAMPASGNEKIVTVIQSPPLSKLISACNQKSLNLYAEAFCKTLAASLYKKGSWAKGIEAMKQYAKQQGIDTKMIALNDASGLSPDNRISTYIMAQLFRNDTKENWYPSFFESLPIINELHMKSGYIGGTRSYAGYITLKDGRNACFAFIIHQYTCAPKDVKLRMFQLLDSLK